MIRHELHALTERVKAKQEHFKHRICVCCGASCISSGAEEVLHKLQEEIKSRGLEETVEVIPTGCMGPCNQGPLVKYLPEQTIYQKVDCDNIQRVVQSQLVENKPLEDLLLFADSREKAFVNANEDPFFKQQQKIALKDPHRPWCCVGHFDRAGSPVQSRSLRCSAARRSALWSTR